MTKFKYQAMESTRQESWGEIEADSTDDANARLRSKGLFVTSLKAAKPKNPDAAPPPLWFTLGFGFLVVLISLVMLSGFLMWISSIDANNKASQQAAKTDPACQINLSVSRILMHLPGKYTFVVEEGDEYKFYTWDNCFVKWAKDAIPGEPIRVEGYKDIYNVHLIVHLHDANEIDGAGWQRRKGKFIENGNTNVIE